MMKKSMLLLCIIGLLAAYNWGVLNGNDSPPPNDPPDPDPSGRLMSNKLTEMSHEKYVKKGASSLFKALAKVNLAFAEYEVDQKNYKLLKESLPLFQESQECFLKASETVQISEKYKNVFRNYRGYYSIIYDGKYSLDTMTEVCWYISKADFKGLHKRNAEIIGEMEDAVRLLINDYSVENALAAYRAIQNQFGHYGTTVCRIVTKK